MKKVLVLEDESSIRSFIVINLRRAGYEVVEAETGEEALEKLKIHSDVRVALLDIMLPGIDGFEVCRRIRATNAAIGIIMLTARSQEMDKVTGLMTGADDYVTKPFSPAELTARVDALMRRSGGGVVDAGEIDQPPFLLNTRNRTLEKNGQRISFAFIRFPLCFLSFLFHLNNYTSLNHFSVIENIFIAVFILFDIKVKKFLGYIVFLIFLVNKLTFFSVVHFLINFFRAFFFFCHKIIHSGINRGIYNIRSKRRHKYKHKNCGCN